MSRFLLSPVAIEIDPLRRRLMHPGAGAYVAFEGLVRDHHAGRPVLGLRYEAYEALARAEGTRIVEDALRRFNIVDACCMHRTGTLAVGELAVWVGVSSAHRDAAFAACRYLIDAIKATVPIWKLEQYADGHVEWLHPHPADVDAGPR